jgi:geranylgeranyl diphosphate synthase type II
MDDDDLRRGRPTNHKVFGEAMAILAGDALLTEAFRPARDRAPSRGGPSWCSRLRQAAGAVGMVGGQVLDIAEDRPAEEGYLTRLHRAKTGALLRAAVHAGRGGRGWNRRTRSPRPSATATRWGSPSRSPTTCSTSARRPRRWASRRAPDAAAGRHTYPAVLGLEASRARRRALVDEALGAVKALEPTPGPLAALARYSVERST